MLDLFIHFPCQAKRLARGIVSEMTCFVSSGMSNHDSVNQCWSSNALVACTGVMEAVDAIIEHLKRMSKQVTTPEEIAQV